MPSSQTITSAQITTFAAGNLIKSSEVNANFSTFRGHLLPVSPNTSASTDLTHDLGASDARWAKVWAGKIYPFTTAGAILYSTAAGSIARLPKANDGDILTLVGGLPAWTTPSVEIGFTNPMSTTGALIYGGALGAAQALVAGSNGDVLTLVGGVPAWTTPAADVGFANPMTTQGDIIYATAAGAASRLPIGATGSTLQVGTSGLPGWTTVSSGSGQGGINYVTSYDGESGIGTWTSFKDSAGSLPTDGVGGSPDADFTWTTTSSSPHRDSNSYLLTHTANNRQGNGWAIAFTIASEDQAQVLTLEFSTSVASGTYASGDLIAMIYDVTNSVLIQPVGYSIANSTVIAKNVLTFQSSGNSTSYRLIIFNATSTATAFTMKFDSFKIAPQVIYRGEFFNAPTITKYTSGSGTHTFNPGTRWARVIMVGGGGGSSGSGSSGTAGAGGTGGNTTLGTATAGGGGGGLTSGGGGSGGTATMGTGWTGTALTGGLGGEANYTALTATYLTGGNGGDNPMGGGGRAGNQASGYAGKANTGGGGGGPGTNATNSIWGGGGGGAGAFIDAVIPEAVMSTYLSAGLSYAVGAAGATGTAGTSGTAGAPGGSGYIEIQEFGVPSSVQLSHQTDTRVVTASYTGDGSGNLDIKTSGTILQFDSKKHDTHSFVTTGASWKATAPVNGYYRIAGNLTFSCGSSTDLQNGTIQLFKNGSAYATIGNGIGATGNLTTAGLLTFDIEIQLNAGDYVDIRNGYTVTNLNLDRTAGRSNINISRLSGPQTIAASESISSSYKWGSTQSLTGSNTHNLLQPATKNWDSHSSFASGIFTAPISGEYFFEVQFYLGAGETWASNQNTINSSYSTDGGSTKITTHIWQPFASATAIYQTINYTGSVKLLAGGTIRFYAQNTDGAAAHTLSNGYLNIKRTGNY